MATICPTITTSDLEQFNRSLATLRLSLNVSTLMSLMVLLLPLSWYRFLR